LHKTHFCAPVLRPLACCARGQLPPSAPRSLRHCKVLNLPVMKRNCPQSLSSSAISAVCRATMPDLFWASREFTIQCTVARSPVPCMARRGVYPYLPTATNAPWSVLGGMNKKLRKHVFALYSLPIIFSKNFLSRYVRSIAFIPNLQMQACNVFYQLHLYTFFPFLVSLSLTASFQSSLKTRIKLHIIAYKMSKNCLRG